MHETILVVFHIRVKQMLFFFFEQRVAVEQAYSLAAGDIVMLKSILRDFSKIFGVVTFNTAKEIFFLIHILLFKKNPNRFCNSKVSRTSDFFHIHYCNKNTFL